MDGWMKGRLDTLVFSTSLQPFLCYQGLFGLPQYNTALHFVFDNTLPRSANRLLILALFLMRVHAFQSNRWYCPKIVLVAPLGETRCQSLCLIMSYYPLCPQKRESYTSVYVIEINT